MWSLGASAVRCIFATQLTNKGIRSYSQEVFRRLDKDGDGVLTLEDGDYGAQKSGSPLADPCANETSGDECIDLAPKGDVSGVGECQVRRIMRCVGSVFPDGEG